MQDICNHLQLIIVSASLLSLPHDVMKPKGQIKQAVHVSQKLLFCRTCNTS